MPGPATVPEFLHIVRQSGVLDSQRLDTYLERLRAAAPLPEEPGSLAGNLIRDGLLTPFQVEQFLRGRWRHFLIGKYIVLECVGSGGMCSVYLCEHRFMHRRVAIKVLPVSQSRDPAVLGRFYREARAVAALNHPNIVRAYDIDQDGSLHFLVMEYIDGASLHEIVKRFGPMALDRAANYISQAALGLHYAHQAGLIHRDIKPGNLVLDRQGTVKILDLGLARFFNDESDVLTREHHEIVLGTADYLAPEQALDSHTVDGRADIYSLGLTFYYLLTGTVPFATGTTAQKLIWHQFREPMPIQQLRPEVPAALAAIIAKMMAKDPAARYQQPSEVIAALQPWGGLPVMPPPAQEMPRLPPALQEDAPLPQAIALGMDSTSTPLPEAMLSLESMARLQGESSDQTLPPRRDMQNDLTLRATPARRRGMAVLLGGLLLAAVLVVALTLLLRSPDPTGRNPTGTSTAATKKLDSSLPLLNSLDPKTIPAAERVPELHPDVVAVLGSHHGGRKMMGISAAPGGRLYVYETVKGGGRIWDAFTGADLIVIAGQGGDMTSAVLSPDAKALVASTSDGATKLWDVATGKERASFPNVLRDIFLYVADGKFLVLAGQDKTVKIYDMATGKEQASLPGHAAEISGLNSLPPRGDVLLSGSKDATIRLWDLASRKERAILQGHTGKIMGISASADGQALASASEDKTVRLWETATGKERLVAECAANSYWPVFSRDGKQLAVGAADHAVQLWDVASRQLVRGHTGHAESLHWFAFAPDGRTFISWGVDGHAIWWDRTSGQKLREWRLPKGTYGDFLDDRHLWAMNGQGPGYILRLPAR